MNAMSKNPSLVTINPRHSNDTLVESNDRPCFKTDNLHMEIRFARVKSVRFPFSPAPLCDDHEWIKILSLEAIT